MQEADIQVTPRNNLFFFYSFSLGSFGCLGRRTSSLSRSKIKRNTPASKNVKASRRKIKRERNDAMLAAARLPSLERRTTRASRRMSDRLCFQNSITCFRRLSPDLIKGILETLISQSRRRLLHSSFFFYFFYLVFIFKLVGILCRSSIATSPRIFFSPSDPVEFSFNVVKN